MLRIKLPLLALCCALALPASAHHSFAMFDREKKISLNGVVKEFQWTNPHVWIQILVSDDKGATTEWGVECTSVNFMARRGWSKDTLKPGDKVAVVISPLKDGSPGGSFRGITSVNGNPLTLEAEE